MKKIAFVTTLIFLCFNKSLLGFSIDVDVLNKYFKPIAITGVKFYTTNKTEDYGVKLLDNISQLLSSTGIINLTIQEKNTGMIGISNNNIDFAIFRPNLISYAYSQYTFFGKIIDTNTNNFKIEISIFNNVSGKAIKTFGYLIPKDMIKSKLLIIAKNISNEIYYQITNTEGYFENSLIYTNGKELMIADYLGNNKKTILKVDGQIYAPIFSPDKERIIYVLFKNGISEIYIYNMITKTNERLAKLKGLSLSPVLSKDSQTLLFSVMARGAANIFSYDFRKKALKQLTNSYSINLPGSFSSDGETIIFNSDRNGRPQIYSMNKSGKKVTQISKGKGAYYTPSFAPNRDIILFTNLQNKKFYIGILSMTGGEKIISNEVLVESPRWVNGRTVAYQYVYAYNKKRKPLYAFYMLDILSGYKISIRPEYNSEDPSFSNGKLMPDSILDNKYNIKTYNLNLQETIFFKDSSTNDFEDGSSLSNNQTLVSIVSYLKDYPSNKLLITGTSSAKDSSKNKDYNLTQLRINSIKHYLISQGISSEAVVEKIYQTSSKNKNEAKNANNEFNLNLLLANVQDNK